MSGVVWIQTRLQAMAERKLSKRSQRRLRQIVARRLAVQQTKKPRLEHFDLTELSTTREEDSDSWDDLLEVHEPTFSMSPGLSGSSPSSPGPSGSPPSLPRPSGSPPSSPGPSTIKDWQETMSPEAEHNDEENDGSLVSSEIYLSDVISEFVWGGAFSEKEYKWFWLPFVSKFMHH